MSDHLTQSTPCIMMVRPRSFGLNQQTMHSNAFQRAEEVKPREAAEKAIHEFDQLVAELRRHEIVVEVIEDTEEPIKPDALFPNNWLIFHHDGAITLCPMEAENRRLERRLDIIDQLRERYLIGQLEDLSSFEQAGRYLEGTGSIVFDHPNRLAYACRSSRTDEGLLNALCQHRHYESLIFDAEDEAGRPIYHTNVMLCVGSQVAVICLEAIKEEEQSRQVVRQLEKGGHQIVAISMEQMKAFAGNMIELRNRRGQHFMLMSSRAYHSLEEEQRSTIEAFSSIIHSPLPTIENLGGGSARCMVAEIFTPPLAL